MERFTKENSRNIRELFEAGTDTKLPKSRAVRPQTVLIIILAVCLIIGAGARIVSVRAGSSQIRTWVIDEDLSALNDLNVKLPKKLGEYPQTSLKFFERITDGEEDEYFLSVGDDYKIKPGSQPIYRSYYLEYSVKNKIEHFDESGHGARLYREGLFLTFGFTEGLKDEDWMTFFHYDPETKKWIPYEYNESSVLIRTVENLEEISYRGATIWIYDLVSRRKDEEKPDYYDAGVHWYDPEIGAYFSIDFDTFTIAKFPDGTYDKDGNPLIEVVRPTNVLDKDTLLKYVKEIIDLNR